MKFKTNSPFTWLSGKGTTHRCRCWENLIIIWCIAGRTFVCWWSGNCSSIDGRKRNCLPCFFWTDCIFRLMKQNQWARPARVSPSQLHACQQCHLHPALKGRSSCIRRSYPISWGISDSRKLNSRRRGVEGLIWPSRADRLPPFLCARSTFPRLGEPPGAITQWAITVERTILFVEELKSGLGFRFLRHISFVISQYLSIFSPIIPPTSLLMWTITTACFIKEISKYSVNGLLRLHVLLMWVLPMIMLQTDTRRA